MKISNVLTASLIIAASIGFSQEKTEPDTSKVKKTDIKKENLTKKELKKADKKEKKTEKEKTYVHHCPACGMG